MRCRQFESVAAHVIGDVYRIHAAFLARQVPTSGRRRTVAKTDSRGGTPFRRPLRYRSQAMGKNAVTDCKKYTAYGLVRRGRPLTSQTAFGGQLPYKGSLVRPDAIFDYSSFLYDGELLRATSHEPLFFHELRFTRGDVVILSLLPQSGILSPRRPAACDRRGRQA